MQRAARWLARGRYHLRNRCIDAACRVGLRPWILSGGKDARVLIFHGVVPAEPLGLNTRFVSTERFEDHLLSFQSRFHLVSLSELFAGVRHRQKMTVAITFDDGYRNNWLYALPILRRLDVPATFFVTTLASTPYPMLWPDYLDVASYLSTKPIEVAGRSYVKKHGVYVDDDGQSLKERCKVHGWQLSRLIYDAFPEAVDHPDWSDLSDYWQLMSSDELRQLAAEDSVEVGLHGHVHEHLGQCSVAHCQQVLADAKTTLEGWIGRPVTALAYPDGSYSRPLLGVAQSLGLTEQYAVQYLHHEDRADARIRDRLTINPFVSADVQTRAVIDGHYGTQRSGFSAR